MDIYLAPSWFGKYPPQATSVHFGLLISNMISPRNLKLFIPVGGTVDKHVMRGYLLSCTTEIGSMMLCLIL